MYVNYGHSYLCDPHQVKKGTVASMYITTRILATITTITVIIMTILMVGKHEGGEEYGAGGKLQESAPRAPKPRAWRLLPPTLRTTLASSPASP